MLVQTGMYNPKCDGEYVYTSDKFGGVTTDAQKEFGCCQLLRLAPSQKLYKAVYKICGVHLFVCLDHMFVVSALTSVHFSFHNLLKLQWHVAED